MSFMKSVAFICDKIHLNEKNQSIVTEPKANKEALTALFDNLDLILKHRNLIYKTPDFYGIHIDGILAGGMYIGICRLHLGDLLALWEHTNWHTDDMYFYSVGGSPLSGQNISRWYDAKHKKFKDGNCVKFFGKGWGVLGFKAFNYVQHGDFVCGSNKIKCVGWTKEHKKSDMTIFDLIDRLKTM